MALNVAIFCGSSLGEDETFRQAAKELTTLLVKQNITIVYGGGNAGLMGVVANTALDLDGHVIGVIPEFLNTLERKHDFLSQQFVVNTMHERKNMLYQKCDAAIVLPGGLGTLDELFEMLTWNQLTLHDKKAGLLNINGFYDHLLAHLHLLKKHHFIKTGVNEMITIASTPRELLEKLQL